jgi:glycosyltransferase involved in cell wall biosynthesis
MKIALVRTASNELRLGSYNIQEIGLAKALLNHGVSSDFYACFSNVTQAAVYLEKGNAKIVILPLKGFQLYKEIVIYPKLYCYLKEGGYSAVLLEDDSQVMLPYLFKRLKALDVKTILWQGMYRDFESRLTARLQKIYDFCCKRLIIQNAGVKLAKTEFARHYLIQKGYTDVELLSVGLDTVVKTPDESLEYRVREFCQTKSKVLLYVGVVDSRRDILFLVELLKGLKSDKVGLIIVGDGKGLEHVEKSLAEFSLSDSVMVLKHVENSKLHLIYSNSHVFLLPTRYEIFGMVVLEALSFGVPVIATKQAGPMSILDNEVLGLCADLNYDQWLAAILFYFSNHQSSESAAFRKSIVSQKYNWDSIAVQFLQYIS